MLDSSAPMNPVTRKYEGVFIFPPEDGPEASKEGEKHLEELLRRLGGRTLDRKDWGRRALGYSIRKFREGRVLVWNFEMEAQRVEELKKVLTLDEKILQSIVVKMKEPKPAPERTRKKPHSQESPPRESGREGREMKEGSHGR